MNKIIRLLLSSFVIVGCMSSVLAQQNFGVMYIYDDAGNRTMRQVITFNQQQKTNNDSVPGNLVESEEDPAESKVENDETATLESKLSGAEISIFPNPVSTTLTVQLSNLLTDADVEITIHEMSGRLLHMVRNSTAYEQISFQKYSAGTYVMKIRIDKEQNEWIIIKK